MRIRDERGMALPLVLGVTVLVFLLVTAVLSQSMQARHSHVTDWRIIRAQYAAESGIALMQAQACEEESFSAITTQENGMAVTTQSQRESGEIVITSVAEGQGVKQTVRVRLDMETCQVVRWER
ncbi:hypothetical protein [Desmospora activa]|uniref:Uncharacterized protein n=1 Tax=Desmospora activa DSM 45169 TaxID=1121389 RepID=A0A2T4ZBT9_9BACL|nr:hypothetical protein [Desmospora activa]PTM59349.1 hypothetical protein C8J48_1962 [Desmospora activa DSM 45169]